MSYIPGTQRLIYSQTTVKAGDILNANAVVANAFQTFASNVTLPANSMVPGQKFVFDFMGLFTSSTFGPTTTARVMIGSSAVVVTPALSVPLGVTGYGYYGSVLATVVTSGAGGSVRAGGFLTFQTGAMTSTTIIVPEVATAVDTTVANVFALGASFSAATAANSNTLTDLGIYEVRPVKASS